MRKPITPGPWTVSHRHVQCIKYDDELHGLGPEPASDRGQFARSADAILIANAPDMAERIVEQEAQIAILEEFATRHAWRDCPDLRATYEEICATYEARMVALEE